MSSTNLRLACQWEIRESQTTGAKTLSGLAAVYYNPKRPGTEFRLRENLVERMLPGAFKDVLHSGQDVLALWSHQRDKPLARVSAGTLRLTDTAEGLRFDLDLPRTTDGQDAAENVRNGNVQGASIGFGVPAGGDRWRHEDNTTIREIVRAELHEVSPVAVPAYPDTAVAIRSRDHIRDAEASYRAYRLRELRLEILRHDYQ